jgi:flagellar basal-body rod modification protein FlgD
MSVVEPVTNTFSTPSSAELNTSEGLKDSFLTMLMAQLQYQDPLDPMENSEFTAQLAQINTVEQLQQVNRNLGYQQLYMASINNSQALDFIGKEIVAKGSTVHWNGETPSNLHYSLEGNAAGVVVNIYDENGRFVSSLHQGEQKAGKNTTTWNGRDGEGEIVPEGTYTYEVLASDVEGNPVNATRMLSGVVDGITFKDGISYVSLGGQNIAIGDIIEIKSIRESDSEQDDESGTLDRFMDTIETLGKTAAKVAPLFL